MPGDGCKQQRPDDNSKPGRPTELNAATAQIIVKAMAAGNYLETAAALGGVTAKTVRNWIRRGEARRREPLYSEFAQSFSKAIAQAEIENVEAIRGDGSWQARAWLLERRHPKRWARCNRPEPKEEPKPPPSMDQVIREINEKLGEASLN
jgi:transposase